MLHDLKIAFFLATRSIRRGNISTLTVTLLIMMLSVINLLFMPSLLDGMDYKSQLQTVEMQFGHVVVEPKEGLNSLTSINALEKSIQAFPEVAGYSSQYILPGTLKFEDRTKSFPVIFINPHDDSTVTKVHESMVEGTYLSKLDTDEIIMGKEVSGTYEPTFESDSLGGVIVGDWITITYPSGLQKDYKVKGVYDTGDIGANMVVYLNRKELGNIGLDDTEASRMTIRLTDESLERPFITRLTEIGINHDVYRSRDRSGVVLTQVFNVMKAIMITIALLISIATLFIVIYINAVNKRKLIATIKAIGVNRKIIILSFVLQSMFYALAGIVLGLGILYLILVPYFRNNPLELPFGMVSLMVRPESVILDCSIFIGFAILGGLIPAYQIVKENIIEAMRK